MYSRRSASCACFIGNLLMQSTFTMSFGVTTSISQRGPSGGLLAHWRPWWAPRLAHSGHLQCSNGRNNLVCLPRVSPLVLEPLPRPSTVTLRTSTAHNRLGVERRCESLFLYGSYCSNFAVRALRRPEMHQRIHDRQKLLLVGSLFE